MDISVNKIIEQSFDADDDKCWIDVIAECTWNSKTYFFKGIVEGNVSYENLWSSKGSFNEPPDGEDLAAYSFDDAALDDEELLFFDTLEAAQHPEYEEKSRTDVFGKIRKYKVCINQTEDSIGEDVDDNFENAVINAIDWKDVPSSNEDDLSEAGKFALSRIAASESEDEE